MGGFKVIAGGGGGLGSRSPTFPVAESKKKSQIKKELKEYRG